MSEETTQDLTQFQLDTEVDVLPDPYAEMDDAESIATIVFEDVVRVENQEFSIYPGMEFSVGRETSHASSTYCKTFKHFPIHDGRVSKRHFRVYSIIYEQNNSSYSQAGELPPLVYCEDLESSNGTYVNGDLIGIFGKERMPHLLCDGDVIEIRPDWKFTFHQSNHRMIFPTSAQSRDMEYFIKRYTVSDRVLGSGHFGNVYLAKELTTNKQIACKVIDLGIAIRSVAESRSGYCGNGDVWRSGVESAKRHRKKVLLEIEILSKLSHPNIINIQKAFYSTNALYIFTDLAPAGDLYSYTQSRGGHLDDYDARVVTKQVTLALEYLHSEGIAHRDIKQENVLVTSTDFGGRVVLTDFGFATHPKIINGRTGRMMSKVGTPGFVAPEVDGVERTDLGYTKAADMWSLGVLTASLLTGALDIPHQELEQLSQVEIADRFLGVDNSYAQQQWKEMQPRALRFVRKLLMIDPEQRMTATEALENSWFTKPAREAQALDEGLQRINRFWEKRTIPSVEVLEAFPGVILSSPASAEAPGPKSRKKMPDATSSPYFGLDRHLTQKAPSGRKRLLEDLNESGSQFVQSKEPQPSKSTANISAQRMNRVSRITTVEATDLFGMSPQKEINQNVLGDNMGFKSIDSVSNVDLSDAIRDGDDLDLVNYTHRAVSKSDYSLTVPRRPSPVAVESDSSGGKLYRASDMDPRTSDATLNERARYTTAGPLRKMVGRMKY